MTTPVIPITMASLSKLKETKNNDDVLSGLHKRELGFVIAAPEVGKGFFCLSVAYELATKTPFLGISSCTKPKRTLYWPIEDGMHTAANRIENHLLNWDAAIKPLEKNIALYASDTPLPVSLKSNDDVATVNTLIEAAKPFDLLIIDTLREAIGAADEVEDDIAVKNLLQHIAKEADIAILCVHHLTKQAVKGLEKITNVSGSGFSRTLANSRVQYLLETKTDKSGRANGTVYLSHLKANNLPVTERLKNTVLGWSETSLLYREDTVGTGTGVSYTAPLEKIEITDEEPVTIELSKANISEQTSRISSEFQAKSAESIFSQDDLKAYSEYKRSKEKKGKT